MIRSLSIKLVMLAGMLGLIMPLVWSGPEHRVEPRLTPKPPSVSLSHAVASTTVTSDSKVENSTKKPLSSLEQDPSGNSNRTRPNTNAIDLNSSTAQELESLPGIGPTLAKRIVDHRMQIGGFQSIQALDQVKGIGKKKLHALSPLVKISPYVVVKKQQR